MGACRICGSRFGGARLADVQKALQAEGVTERQGNTLDVSLMTKTADAAGEVVFSVMNGEDGVPYMSLRELHKAN